MDMVVNIAGASFTVMQVTEFQQDADLLNFDNLTEDEKYIGWT